MPLTGFEPESSGVGSDRAVDCATTTIVFLFIVRTWLILNRDQLEMTFINFQPQTNKRMPLLQNDKSDSDEILGDFYLKKLLLQCFVYCDVAGKNLTKALINIF